MKESEKIFASAEKEFDLAQIAWKEKRKDASKEHYFSANYGMMRAYLISEGIMHMEKNNSIHDAFRKIWIKDPVFSDKYAHELNYFDLFYNKRGYFKEHPDLNTQLKNDFNKLHKKLRLIALAAIKKNPEDKIVDPDDIVDFVDDISNLIPKGVEKTITEKKEPKVSPPEKKKGFFSKLFKNVTIEVNVNKGKKK